MKLAEHHNPSQQVEKCLPASSLMVLGRELETPISPDLSVNSVTVISQQDLPDPAFTCPQEWEFHKTPGHENQTPHEDFLYCPPQKSV